MDLKFDYDEEKVVLADTPGFGDTRCPEIDCANSFAIQEALE